LIINEPTASFAEKTRGLGGLREWFDVAHRFTLDPNALQVTRLYEAPSRCKRLQVPVNHLAAEARGWYAASLSYNVL
jgi:hypothetical protein